MNTDHLKQLILEQRLIFFDVRDSIDREALRDKRVQAAIRIEEPVLVTGVRRCGKSHFMRLIWSDLKAQHQLSDDQVTYVNFDSEKLTQFTTEDFDRLISAQADLFPIPSPSKRYLFLDEIQEIPGWEKFVARLSEDKRYKIFVGGSNANMLSKELGTHLTGRHIDIELFPLSFREVVQWKLGTLSPADLFNPETQSNIRRLFQHYLENGGFPQVQKQDARLLLDEYLKDIIYRDVVKRHRIRHEQSLRQLAHYLLANPGTILSFKKLARMVTMKNISTVKNYLSYLHAAYLFLPLAQHSFSIKQQIYNPDKFYAIDTGLFYELAFKVFDTEARALENMVFIELRRRRFETYYFRSDQECDFIVCQKSTVVEAIQVTQIFEPHNEQREILGLVAALQKYNLDQGLILTKDVSKEFEHSGKKIRVMPIWRWCLEGQV